MVFFLFVLLLFVFHLQLAMFLFEIVSYGISSYQLYRLQRQLQLQHCDRSKDNLLAVSRAFLELPSCRLLLPLFHLGFSQFRRGLSQLGTGQEQVTLEGKPNPHPQSFAPGCLQKRSLRPAGERARPFPYTFQ